MAGASESAWDLLYELEVIEARVRRQLQAQEASSVHFGAPVLDYALSQLRFFQAGWRELKGEGLPDAEAMRQAELLSLPECLRHARAPWQRDLLLDLAFNQGRPCWQRALDARHPEDEVGALPPRDMAPPPMVQLSPYPSPVRLPPRYLVTLEAHFYPDVGLAPSPIHPFRRGDGVPPWTLQLWLFHKSTCGSLIVHVDPPWPTDPSQVPPALRALADHYERLAVAGAEHGSLEAKTQRQWHDMAGRLRSWANEYRRLKPGRRSRILQACFSLPGLITLTPVAFITEDMTPGQMAQVLQDPLKARGLLSVREGRRLLSLVEQELLLANPAMSPLDAAALARGVRGLVRPLRRQSVEKYDRKLSRRLGPGRERRPGAIPRGRLKAISARFHLNPRTLSRRFRAYRADRGLSRDARSLQGFARYLKRKLKKGGEGTNRFGENPALPGL